MEATQHCYRHPAVETRISCSECDRPICPDCVNVAPVGQRCPECAGKRQVVRSGRSVFESAPGATTATYALLGINVAVFVAEVLTGAASGVGEGLTRDGGLNAGLIAEGGEWWRVVTSGFLHSGPLHLLLNMFALYVLGTILEPSIGTARFVAIYVASLLAGSLGALIVEPNALTVGASGAIYGLLASTFFIARHRGSQFASEIGLWLVLNLVFTFTISGISIGGHLGGLAGGAVAAGIVIGLESALSGRGRRRGQLELAALIALGVACFGAALLVAESASDSIPL